QTDDGRARKSGAQNLPACVVRLKTVYVGFVAVDCLPDRVTSTMKELVAITSFLNDPATGRIHFIAERVAPSLYSRPYELQSGITALPDHIEHRAMFFGNR